MKILLTNDDGLESEALQSLANALSEKHEVLVAAPDRQQSGVGHAFTFYKSLSVHKREEFAWECYAVGGTPSDCTKYAIVDHYKHEGPDLVLSGPNAGENSGVAVIYSGTVAGAREAALWNIPAIALSLHIDDEESRLTAIHWVENLIESGKYKEIQKGYYWNVNFPDLTDVEEPLETRFTQMSTVMFEDWYDTVDSRDNTKDVQLAGFKPKEKFHPNSDDFHHYQGFISVTPLQVDQTAHSEFERLRNLNNTDENLFPSISRNSQ